MGFPDCRRSVWFPSSVLEAIVDDSLCDVVDVILSLLKDYGFRIVGFYCVIVFLSRYMIQLPPIICLMCVRISDEGDATDLACACSV